MLHGPILTLLLRCSSAAHLLLVATAVMPLTPTSGCLSTKLQMKPAQFILVVVLIMDKNAPQWFTAETVVPVMLASFQTNTMYTKLNCTGQSPVKIT